MDNQNNILCLNKDFSTTKQVTRKQPIIINKSEDSFKTVFFLPESKVRKSEGGLRTKGYFKKCLPNKPLITIITVVFEGEKYIEETIQSVITQTYDNVEYIVIDAGSTDGTLNIIQKYTDVIDYWISESDKGIYDAMNKGIQLALGKWINFMNAGDSFSSVNLLDKIKETLSRDYSIVYSDVLIKNRKNTITQYSRDNKNWWKGTPFCHQSAFFNIEKNKFFYDLSYPLAADYDYALKIFSCYSSAKKEKNMIAIYDSGGISSQKSFAAALQMYTVAKKYYRFSFYMHCYYFLKLLRRLLDFYKK